MTPNGDKALFLAAVAGSLESGTFVRVTLGKYRGTRDVDKVVITRVTLKNRSQLKFVTSFSRKDETQNHSILEGLARIEALVGEDFLSATLFTIEADTTLLFSKKKSTQLKRAKPTFSAIPSADHNRAKNYIVDPARPYLHELGVTTADGIVKPSMNAKFRQICHFVEIVDQLVRETDALRDAPSLTVVDIGAGKGYLTFALYDYLTGRLAKQAQITGIEVRGDLVALCNDIAKRSGFQTLLFRPEAAEQATVQNADVMIALHACDTATDDAIYQGVSANSALILVAPCCQHELAPQLKNADAALAGMMKFGLFKQRQADLITDAARCLLLEACGYRVKVIEFVSTDHTAKNVMIAAVRDANIDRVVARRHYDSLKALAGFKTQHLEKRLFPAPEI